MSPFLNSHTHTQEMELMELIDDDNLVQKFFDRYPNINYMMNRFANKNHDDELKFKLQLIRLQHLKDFYLKFSEYDPNINLLGGFLYNNVPHQLNEFIYKYVERAKYQPDVDVTLIYNLSEKCADLAYSYKNDTTISDYIKKDVLNSWLPTILITEYDKG